MSWLVMQDTPGSGPGGVLVYDRDEAEQLATERRADLARCHGQVVRVWVQAGDPVVLKVLAGGKRHGGNPEHPATLEREAE